ncbi:MAG: helix-turn-helix domain-containing protein [Burkholderiales bacterium]
MSAGPTADAAALVMPLRRSAASGGRSLAEAAAAWLRAHLTDALSIGDLCAALDVRERTLHAAFCEHLSSSPKAYLKALRLTAARGELLRADRETRVTDVALRWGFLHFGWFAHDYRRHFSETPSATLRRGFTRSTRPGEVARCGRSKRYAA